MIILLDVLEKVNNLQRAFLIFYALIIIELIILLYKNIIKKARGSVCKPQTSPSRKSPSFKRRAFSCESPFYEDFSLPGVVKYGGEIKED